MVFLGSKVRERSTSLDVTSNTPSKLDAIRIIDQIDQTREGS
jgi:hypothetical protein